MGAPSEIYVDPAGAADSGTGTIGDPYLDLQYALNSVTRDATNGNRFNIKAGTDEILAAILSLATYGVPTFDAPLIFEGYTATAGDGGIGGINGNAGNFSIIAAIACVHFVRLHLHNTGTAVIVNVTTRGSCVECEVDNSSGGGISQANTESLVAYNYVHNCGGIGINSSGGEAVIGNYLANGIKTFTAAISIGATDVVLMRNIISIAGTTKGINCTTGRGVVEHNSIFSAGGTGIGIEVPAASKLAANLRNNIVEGFSGAGGIGITIEAGTRNMIHYGHNAVYNCTTDYNVDDTEIIYPTGDNETLIASPFAKSGADTFANRAVYFAPVDTGNVHGGAYPTELRLDKGAVQHADPAGGGNTYSRGRVVNR